MPSSVANNGAVEQPEPKRRRLLDAGGPIEDDETARQKMREAKVYARGVDGTWDEYVGFDPDNVEDVKSDHPYDAGVHDHNATTPMGYFARKRGLRMMRWLYVNGAATREVDVAANFPMYRAACRGHLVVCKWLFDHGAAKDVKRRNQSSAFYSDGHSPLHAALGRSEEVSRWLILNGALCKDDDSGDLDVGLMKQDLRIGQRARLEDRKALLEWASDLHLARNSFLLFLSGVRFGPKDACSFRQTVAPLQLLSGEPGIRKLIGDFVGCVRGREAKIIRQLTEMMPNSVRQQHERRRH